MQGTSFFNSEIFNFNEAYKTILLNEPIKEVEDDKQIENHEQEKTEMTKEEKDIILRKSIFTSWFKTPEKTDLDKTFDILIKKIDLNPKISQELLSDISNAYLKLGYDNDSVKVARYKEKNYKSNISNLLTNVKKNNF